MKQKLLILTGVLALAPTLAVADYCRDCRDDAHTHTYQHDHRHYDGHDQKAWKKTWKKAQRKHAREHRRVVFHNGNDFSSTAYARVVDVEPVYRYYTQTVQDTSCLQRNRQYTGHTNWAPAVLGAVIGGAVGHRVGDAQGDPDAAAIAGGLLGAAIGRDVAVRERESRALSVRGPCQSVQRETRSREPVEYVVTYRYNGQVYRTHMDRHPGEWVELDVNINPV